MKPRAYTPGTYPSIGIELLEVAGELGIKGCQFPRGKVPHEPLQDRVLHHDNVAQDQSSGGKNSQAMQLGWPEYINR
jgi:hypothetical protein